MTPEQIAQKHELTRRGHRWAGPCPSCGGSRTSDKFDLREDGGYKCYSCGIKGDAITWHRQFEGLSCPEAFEAIGRRCDRHDCAVRATCRMGDGSAKPIVRKHTPSPKAAPKARITQERTPADLWQAWATELLRQSADHLQSNPQALAWLAERGITRASGPGYALGWHPEQQNIERARIGLPPTNKDGKTTLWVPAGHVIATIDHAGQVYRLRIRRTDDDRQRFAPDLKYVWLDGSGNAPLEIPATGEPRGTLIVEAELDAIASACAHPDATVMGLGTVDMPPTAEQAQRLAQTPVILVALDADPGTLDKPGPGIKAYQTNWQPYRHARFWPVPAGKDPGEYVQDCNGNLHTWIEAGLAPAKRRPSEEKPAAGRQDKSLIVSTGGGGAAAETETNAAPAHYAGTSHSGLDYIVAETRADVRTLRQHYPGAAVFHPAEIKRLKGIQRHGAEQLLNIKTIFDNAEILGLKQIETP